MQYEAGVKYQPTWLSDVMFSASLFDLTRQNAVTGDGQINFNRQIGKVNSRGVEIEAVGQLTPDLKLTGAYTWYDLSEPARVAVARPAPRPAARQAAPVATAPPRRRPRPAREYRTLAASACRHRRRVRSIVR
ncbi:TonB-dependent receptor [Mesorhizobium sp. B2-7-1]|uniref:TonB-dependent receptor domain-containing protein n=1 Tax=Mesorhizobium sp. B2-7-1 TaxID=2589909 RepID=UPI0015E3D8E0|nr:TonB-dependent receptor [Mesorhizobium sp. B2-7-1]